MHYVSRPASHTSPLRSIPLYRTVESVLRPSAQAKAEGELRVARIALVAELGAYAIDRAALGKANRQPGNWRNAGKGCRAYHQAAAAMRVINARRKQVRAATRRVEAAELALLALATAA